jgi:hypothetical protein
VGNNYYISLMSYPDKYCSNCNKVTERYNTGHCKDCIKRRSAISNAKRNSSYNKTEIIHKKYGNIRKPSFRKEAYSRLTVESVIQELANQKYYFIYFLLKNNRVVYVGQSNNNVLGRISSHLKDKEFDEVYYKSFSVENVMDEYEKKFIMKYRPKFNKEVIHQGVKYDFFDLKTEQAMSLTIEDFCTLTGCSNSTALNLLSGNSKSVYKRYVLKDNKPEHSNFKNVLDTYTGQIKRHNYITFAEEIGVKQNAVWYFMNGFTKSFQKKRYVLVN